MAEALILNTNTMHADPAALIDTADEWGSFGVDLVSDALRPHEYIDRVRATTPTPALQIDGAAQ